MEKPDRATLKKITLFPNFKISKKLFDSDSFKDNDNFEKVAESSTLMANFINFYQENCNFQFLLPCFVEL